MKFISAYQEQTGEQLSFTGYLIACLARAVGEDKAVQSYRKGSKQLVLFDDDLTIIFDHDVIDGAPAARFTRRLIELVESGYGLQEIPLVPRDNQEQAGALT